MSTAGHRHRQPQPTSIASPHTADTSNQFIQTRAMNLEISESIPSTLSPQPSTPPRTPRRTNPPQSRQTSAVHETNGSKQKTRSKHKPKNVVISPVAVGVDRITPPLTGNQSTALPRPSRPVSTPGGAAFAGATFHHSPAPSALPIPSFYSKSVPESPALKGMKALKDAATAKADLKSPSTSALPSTLERHESPLDIFFKADREEKARARSASSFQQDTSSGPFQPPESPAPPHSPSNSASRRRMASPLNRGSNGIFAMELDDPVTPRGPIGPAFSTPYSDQINAARRSRPTSARIQSQPLDRSEQLKAYLFSSPPPSTTPSNLLPAGPSTPNSARQPVSTPPSWQRTASCPQPGVVPLHFESIAGPRAPGRASGLRQEVTPSRTPEMTPEHNINYSQSDTPSRAKENSLSHSNSYKGRPSSHTSSVQIPQSGVSSEQRSAELMGMEDSLRKMLKLDLGGQPAEAPFVGGRPGGPFM